MVLTEKQKMLAGEYYHPGDSELDKDRKRVRALLHEYNTTVDSAKRSELVPHIFGSFGERSYALPNFRCDYGYNIHVGKHVEINYDCTFLDIAKITIGDYTLFGPSVHIYTVNHPLDPTERRTGVEIGKEVKIGHTCWIGGNVTICPGVTIGNGVTIGAGSVVTKDIPDNSVAVGNPAKVIKTITPA
ncbi:hypothetical protein G6F70_000490 [Rhizopus microsporus]|uniref:Maltose/galactoside acetyltransferase domain-containing protein n=1 Tax=Rhizopus azygosporus TaxID=86630 RepID=A0A367JNF9_RHIAZ|nr:hypothetical protein G6F71_000334 [Rhizopus microsporus]RCH91467.1 hypothetical protein CU097_008558 [Rhizopus azygosporus]KAG1204452.1 hypothetical protein G6F70_000490 [Rhizopus microsporus]KAG1215864.1 hypothetical protein G6F69_000590 [Rhizopus microsporus]KAG1238532.1 hypothetical protein G6F67_000327 [Rhizopus microsporus]